MPATALAQTPALAFFSQAQLAEMSPPRTVLRQNQVSCPPDDATTAAAGPRGPFRSGYPNFPVSVCLSQNMRAEQASTWTQGRTSLFIAENRYQTPLRKIPLLPPFPRPLLSGGGQCYTFFSSYRTAEAATRAQIAFSVGAPAHGSGGAPGYLDITEAAGIPDGKVYPHDRFYAAQDALCTGAFLANDRHLYRIMPADMVVLPQGRLADVRVEPVDGVTVDYEPLDLRSETACAGCGSVAQLQAEAAIAHAYGFKFRVYTNPLEGNGARTNDFAPANLVALLGDPQIDHFSVLLAPESYLGAASMGDPHAELIDQLTAANGGAAPPIDAAFLAKISATVQIGATGARQFSRMQFETIKRDLDDWNIGEIDLFPKGVAQNGEVCPRPANPALPAIAILLGIPLPC